MNLRSFFAHCTGYSRRLKRVQSPIKEGTIAHCTLFNAIFCLVSVSLYAQETVHLKNGNFQKGSIVSRSDGGITFEFQKSGGGAASRVNIPWNSIDRIEFPTSPAEQKALADPGAVPLATLAKLWEEKSDWLSRPRSNAAQVGLIYAKKLADSKEEMAPEQALDLFKLISEQAWDEKNQAAAIRERLLALISMGRERDAIREAEALAEASENPALLLEAKQVLAANAFEKLKAIEEENPRWELDDDVRPCRNKYFNEAIDHALFAYLFYGSEESAAARGLIFAAEIYRFTKDNKNSKLCAEDILKLYPNTEFTDRARAHLAEISKQETE